LDVGVKVVYTAFLAFTACGVVTMGLLHVDGMGTSAAAAQAWWAGDGDMAYPKSYRQLLELTHFHLFTEPITWLILAHLYNLGGDPVRRRVAVSVVSILAIAAQVALPWVVVYGPGPLAVALLPCNAAVGGTLAYMAVAAVRDMWFSRRPGPA
jgi:hypothetical protein